MSLGLTLACAVLGLVIVLLVIGFRHRIRRYRSSKKLAILLGLVLVLAMVLTWFVVLQKARQGKETAKKQELTIKPSSPPKNNGDASLPAYEVVKTAKQGSITRMTVYVGVRDKNKLKTLSDYLLSQRQDLKIKPFYIDYFDNRDVAQVYFEKISTKLNNEEQRSLFSHYLAITMIDADKPAKFYYFADTKELTKQLQEDRN